MDLLTIGLVIVVALGAGLAGYGIGRHVREDTRLHTVDEAQAELTEAIAPDPDELPLTEDELAEARETPPPPAREPAPPFSGGPVTVAPGVHPKLATRSRARDVPLRSPSLLRVAREAGGVRRLRSAAQLVHVSAAVGGSGGTPAACVHTATHCCHEWPIDSRHGR